MTTVAPADKRAATIIEWQTATHNLLDEISDWVKMEPGWTTERTVRTTAEEELGRYEIEDLLIQTPMGILQLTPVARHAFKGTGTMELSAVPSYYRVRLVRDGKPQTWRVRTDSGIYLRQDWNSDNFKLLARDLLTAG